MSYTTSVRHGSCDYDISRKKSSANRQIRLVMERRFGVPGRVIRRWLPHEDRASCATWKLSTPTRQRETLLPQLYAVGPAEDNSLPLPCDCLAHRYGNAADHRARIPSYPSDMTDTEWTEVRDLLPVPAWMGHRGGRPEGYCHREILDAIRYAVDNGGKWAALPVDYPPYKRVHAFFTRWRDHGLIAEFHDRLRDRVRFGEGRDPRPTAAVIDSQSVKAAATVHSPTRGFDGGKLIKGRRRHLIVDTLGLAGAD